MNLKDVIYERERLKIQLEPKQLYSIVKAIGDGCCLLIFGLGNDTPFWLRVNKNGTTVFIEDNKLWVEKVKRMYPKVKYLFVKYNTKITQYRKLLNKTEKLNLKLSDEIRNIKWNVILVDAPQGFKNEHPGRMKSIYEASILTCKGGHVFVHDCHRDVEKVYADKYLLASNLFEEITTLRHYVM